MNRRDVYIRVDFDPSVEKGDIEIRWLSHKVSKDTDRADAAAAAID
jgi:hypothetical protein